MSRFLYVFIDESGNFDFSSRGTKFFSLTALSTIKPVENRLDFNELKYSYLCQGQNQEFFHATEDLQAVRDEVFLRIKNKVVSVEIDSVIAQKNKAHPSLYKVHKFNPDGTIRKTIIQADEFYRILCQTLLRYVMQRYSGRGVDGIVIVLSSLFTNQRSSSISGALKQYLRKYLNLPFYIYFHRSESDMNSQIVDYCGWAIYVKHERGELRPYQEIAQKIKSEFDIFQRGTTLWY